MGGLSNALPDSIGLVEPENISAGDHLPGGQIEEPVNICVVVFGSAQQQTCSSSVSQLATDLPIVMVIHNCHLSKRSEIAQAGQFCLKELVM